MSSSKRVLRMMIAVAMSAVQLFACRGSEVAAAPPPTPTKHVGAIALADMQVTHGHVSLASSSASDASGAGLLHIDDPTTRFVVPGTSASAKGGGAELRFTYRGPSAKSAKLASGESRQQLGLKLRAHDGCNLVYVMWRLGPASSRLVVSVKRNPGASTHAECGVGGYENVTGQSSSPLPMLKAGDSGHVLAASILGDRLRVLADGQSVWEGALPDEAFTFDGPVGVRTDNVDVDFSFAAH